MSVYNNSGRDLAVVLSNNTHIAWKVGEYLTLENVWSDAIRDDDGQLIFEAEDSAGTTYQDVIDGKRAQSTTSAYFVRHVYPGQGYEQATAPRISGEPQYACHHLRIEPDAGLYLLANGCGQRDQKRASTPKQADIFPIRPQVQEVAPPR